MTFPNTGARPSHFLQPSDDAVPLAAFGAANDWWFLNNRGAPVPTTAPQVVKEGEWDGQPWQLIASGAVVACLTPRTAKDDISTLSDCT